MATKVLFGIDPGNNGGIIGMFRKRDTDWNDGDWQLIRSFKLERGEDAIVCFVRDTVHLSTEQPVAYLEKVHGWGEGRSFNFGMYYGFVRGVLKAFSVEVVDVTPQKWMKEMGVPPQKGQKAAHRLAMRELAGSMQDDVTTTNWNSAAVLIALYGLRQLGGVYKSDAVVHNAADEEKS